MQSVIRSGYARTLNAIINAELRGEVDETLTRRLHDLVLDAEALAMLAGSGHVAEQDTVIAALQGRGRDLGLLPQRQTNNAVRPGERARCRNRHRLTSWMGHPVF